MTHDTNRQLLRRQMVRLTDATLRFLKVHGSEPETRMLAYGLLLERATTRRKGPTFAGMFDKLSKAMLIDVLYCCLPTWHERNNETTPEIMTQAARNAVVAAIYRDERLPRVIRDQAKQPINAD